MVKRLVDSYLASWRGLPATVWLMCLGALVNRAGSMVLPFLGLYLSTQLGFSVARVGAILAAWGLGSMLGSWIGGLLSDRVGTVQTQLGSFFVGGIGLLGYLVWREPLTLWIATFLTAVVVDAHRPGMMVAIARLAPPGETVRSLSLMRIAINLGFAIGPAIGGLLAQVSYRWLFVVDALTCWSAAIPVLLAARLAKSGELDIRPAPSGETPWSPWRDGAFLRLMFGVFAIAVVLVQILGAWPLYLAELLPVGDRLSEAGVGGLLSLSSLLIVVFEMPLIRILRPLPTLKVAAIGGVVLGAGFSMLALGNTMTVLVASTVVWSLGEMLSLPMTNAAVAQLAPPSGQGRAMGAYALTFSTSLVVAPVLGTLALDRLPHPVAWSLAVVLLLPVGLMLWRVELRGEKPAPG